MELETSVIIHLNNIVFVSRLKKNFLSICCLEDKGDMVSFVDGKILVWGIYSSIDNARVIEVHEGCLYRVITPYPHALVHMEINPIELWHRRYGHLH